MTEFDGEHTGIAITLVVVAIILVVGYSVMTAYGAEIGDDLNEYCQDEYGEEWSLDNESETLLCEHPNGSTREPIIHLHGTLTAPRIPLYVVG